MIFGLFPYYSTPMLETSDNSDFKIYFLHHTSKNNVLLFLFSDCFLIAYLCLFTIYEVNP